MRPKDKEYNVIFINPNQTEEQQKKFKELVTKIMLDNIFKTVNKITNIK